MVFVIYLVIKVKWIYKYIFGDLALEIVKENSGLVYIAQNNWITSFRSIKF